VLKLASAYLPMFAVHSKLYAVQTKNRMKAPKDTFSIHFLLTITPNLYEIFGVQYGESIVTCLWFRDQ
jgi:hypothetical protein